ncbi:DUF3291 domain-containing protein [Pseudonocardia sp. ICBG162]|uniref:DUF3291 domain-containing protein n=1 Tax=Pseudonocardia sp. ICBG162 TaxID=2846761 RepID=UPI001CF69820|nr:DUF3291 domain-containing protein [Pseudonocardia sp. ICBG162]
MPELAQANVASLRAPLDDPRMRGFLTALAPIHHLAEHSDGFLWRLRTGDDHGLCVIRDGTGPAFLNLSVWRDYRSLHQFVYRSRHGDLLRQRDRWFDTTRQPSTVLWWVTTGERPTADDATRRLRHLRTYGPTARAFSLRRQFTASGAPVASPRSRSSTPR